MTAPTTGPAGTSTDAGAPATGPADGSGSTDTGEGGNGPENDTEGGPAALVKDDGTPWTLEDITGLQNALKAARREARTAKRGQPATAGDDEQGGDQAAQDAKTAAAAEWKPRVVKSAARAEFARAGLALPAGSEDVALSKALRLLDMDDLEVTDDGDVDGLADQVAEIKTLYPQLFTPATAPKQRPGRVDGADKGAQAGGKTRTSAEILAATLLGTA